jgi:hypothetical protein
MEPSGKPISLGSAGRTSAGRPPPARAYDVIFHVSDLGSAPGEALAVSPAWMTARHYGPVSVLAIWEASCTEPLYLVTNMDDLDLAMQRYQKRAHIETFFSDQKSRGFQIHKTTSTIRPDWHAC